MNVTKWWILIILILIIGLLNGCSNGDPDSKTPRKRIKTPVKVKTGMLWQKRLFLQPVSSVFILSGTKRVLASAGNGEKGLLLSDMKKGELVLNIPTRNDWYIQGNRKATRLYSLGQSSLSVWDTETGRETGRIANTGISSRALALSKDGKYLATGGLDEYISIWSVVDRSKLGTVHLSRGYCWTLAFSPDGKYLAAGGNPTIDIIDLSNRKVVKTLKTFPSEKKFDANIDTFALVFGSRSEVLISGGADCQIRLWNVADGKLKKQYPAGDAVIKSIVSDKGGKRLIFGSFLSLGIMDLASGSIRYLKENSTAFNAISISDDGKYVAVGDKTGTVSLWRLGDL